MKFEVFSVRLNLGLSSSEMNSIFIKAKLVGPFESPNQDTLNVASMRGLVEGMLFQIRVEPTASSVRPEGCSINIIENNSVGSAGGVWKCTQETFNRFEEELRQAKLLGAIVSLNFEPEGDKVRAHSPLSIDQKLAFTSLDVLF